MQSVSSPLQELGGDAEKRGTSAKPRLYGHLEHDQYSIIIILYNIGYIVIITQHNETPTAIYTATQQHFLLIYYTRGNE